MNDNNLPKVDINVDLTKTVEDAYTDGISKPLKSSSKAFTTLMDFFHNTVLYPMQKYNLYANNKLENYAIELQNKVKTIPADNLVSPRVNILGPTIDGLKYNLDEEYIKEMFTNILMSDMDDRTQNKVLPSYIEIVKQLSSEDAKTLCLFKKVNSLYSISHIVSNAPIIKLKYTTNKTHGYFDYNKDTILILDEFNFHVLDSIVVDNLLRLKLIEIDFSKFLFDQPYDSIFNAIRKDEQFKALDDPSSVFKLDYSKGVLELTAFGKNFIDICLS